MRISRHTPAIGLILAFVAALLGSPARTVALGAGPTHERRLQSVNPTLGPLISGRSSYVHGTFVWTDYAYDDRGPDTNDRPGGDATYPATMRPNNVADLIQLQLRPSGAGLSATVTMETLTPVTRPVVGIALDGDGNRRTGAASLPGSWRPSGPLGVDSLFVLGAKGGRVYRAAGGRWKRESALRVDVDPDANTLRAVLPYSLPARGTLRAVAAIGYADASGRSWIDGAIPVHDLAFVKGEPPVTPYLQSVTDAITNFAAGGDTQWQEYRQSAILAGKADPAPAVASIDIRTMRRGRTDIPEPGPRELSTFLYRSALRLGEGVRGSGGEALYAGPYQPYLVWVPKNLRPGLPLVVYMHGSSQTHLSAVNTAPYSPSTRDPVLNLPDAIFDFDAVVVWPLGRGPDQPYSGASERDILDVTDDALARLSLDKERVMLAGLSIGGIGTFRLAQLYPDRWSVAYADVGYDQTNLLENLTSLPLRFQNGAADYFVNAAFALSTRIRVDAAGTIDYRSWFRFNNHHQPAVAQAECVYRESFSRPRVRNPARVRYTVDPTMFVNDRSTGLRLRYEGAYWVSGMRPSSQKRASVDVTSLAFGRVPVPEATTQAVYENITAGRDFCGPNPRVQNRAVWNEQARSVEQVSRAARPVVTGTLTGLSSVRVAADRARIARSGGRLELTSDGRTSLGLTGLAPGTRVTLVNATVRANRDGVATIRLAAGKNIVRILGTRS